MKKWVIKKSLILFLLINNMSKSILEESRQARRGLFSFLFSKKFLIFLAIVLIASFVYYLYFYNKEEASLDSIQQKQYTAKVEDLKISVSATGKVVAKDGVELSFPVSGSLEVDEVFVKEGDKIKKGDKIASVKTESLEFELRSAYNSYQSALASYNSKIADATDSEKKKAEASIQQAEVSLDQAKISLEQTKLNSAQSVANAEAAVKTAADNLKLNNTINDSEIVHNAYLSLINTLKSFDVSVLKQLRDSDSVLGVDDTSINSEFKLALGALDSASFNLAKDSYLKVKNLQADFDGLVNNLNDFSSNNEVDTAALKAKELASLLQDHQRYMQRLLDATIVFSGLSQSKLDGFKSMVNSNQSSAISLAGSLNSGTQSVDNAKSSLSNYQTAYEKALRDLETTKNQTAQNIENAEISLRSRQLSLEQAKSDYEDLLAPLDANELASARSQLTSASITVDRAKYNVSQATLVSPIDGIVSALNYKAGDIILDSSNSSKSVATIINNDTLYIEVNVEESDISKLSVGDKAQVSFDAVDQEPLVGEISFISLTSSTNSNGIVTYLVRVILANTENSAIREGMTASLDFITAEAPGVLSIPVAAVSNIGGQPAVILTDGSVRNIITGFTDGKKVEVISGLEVGEKIIY